MKEMRKEANSKKKGLQAIKLQRSKATVLRDKSLDRCPGDSKDSEDEDISCRDDGS